MEYDRSATLDRREFLTRVGTVGAVTSLALNPPGSPGSGGQASSGITLPPLPWGPAALAPVISENTISFHYGKHHQAYVANTVKLIAGTEFEKSPLEDIIRKTAGRADKEGLFNNAAQVYNHTFFWHSMKPGGGGEPKGKMAEMIKESFGSYSKFVEAFSNAAATQFGSGWAWLVAENGKLKVVKTSNAETPLTTAAKPLLTIDVWEHAYYLDYQNRRGDYIKAFVDKLINWDFAEKNLA